MAVVTINYVDARPDRECYLCSYVVLTLRLFARWEHRPSTKERHRFLSVAIFSNYLLCFFFGVSLPGVSWPTSSPLPWGVPRDGLTGDIVSGGFLSVCPVHLHFLFFFSFSMGRVVAWSFSRV